MAVFNLYSKRQKILRGEIPDVYKYDEIPYGLRVQIIQIITDAIGKRTFTTRKDRPSEIYSSINKILCREFKVFSLNQADFGESKEAAVFNFLLKTDDIEKVLDVIELTFMFIGKYIKEDLRSYIYDTKIEQTPDGAIEELNYRFKESGVGYQYQDGKIIRVDSTYTHSEIVKPVLTLLHNSKFKGANEEYLKAHEHYRHGRNKECLTECLKAFESTMKIICSEKGWTFNQNDTSKNLIKICLQNNLVPTFMQTQISSLESLLQSGIPTIRNRLSGHGQGQIPQKVNDEMTRYALNLTGTNIIFMIEQSGL